MHKGSRTSGYTIIEVMVFLAVSTALFVSAAALISGQQGRTEFTQSLNDVESRIKDIANDVSTGFSPNTNNFNCTSSGTGPIISSGSSAPAQGTNIGCTFIGKVLQFGVQNSNREGFNIYTVAGQRLSGGAGSAEAANLSQAKPAAIALSANQPNAPDAFDALTLQNDLHIVKMYYKVGNAATDIGEVGFFTTFGTSPNGNLVSGSQSIDLVPIPGSTLDMNSSDAADKVDSLSGATYQANPDGGVVLCFESAGSSQYGQITIGSNGRQITTSRLIDSGDCSNAPQ